MYDSNSLTVQLGCPSDTDIDGICDGNDNCPYVANFDQNDVDGDGVGDECDNCLNTSNHSQDDTDADTVGDSCDNCPDYNNPDPNQVDTDSDGIGDICEYEAANLDELSPVNFDDFALLASNWIYEGLNLLGDTNRDEIVDELDLAQVAEHWLD